MQTRGNARDHFWRVIKMSKANSVDLSTALDEGLITSHEYADMITGCQGCERVDQCDRLLARTQQMEEAPEYCVNRAAFAELRKA